MSLKSPHIEIPENAALVIASGSKVAIPSEWTATYEIGENLIVGVDMAADLHGRTSCRRLCAEPKDGENIAGMDFRSIVLRELTTAAIEHASRAMSLEALDAPTREKPRPKIPKPAPAKRRKRSAKRTPEMTEEQPRFGSKPTRIASRLSR